MKMPSDIEIDPDVVAMVAAIGAISSIVGYILTRYATKFGEEHEILPKPPWVR